MSNFISGCVCVGVCVCVCVCVCLQVCVPYINSSNLNVEFTHTRLWLELNRTRAHTYTHTHTHTYTHTQIKRCFDVFRSHKDGMVQVSSLDSPVWRECVVCVRVCGPPALLHKGDYSNDSIHHHCLIQISTHTHPPYSDAAANCCLSRSASWHHLCVCVSVGVCEFMLATSVCVCRNAREVLILIGVQSRVLTSHFYHCW